MKVLCVRTLYAGIVFAFFIVIGQTHAEVLSQWNFNFPLSATADLSDDTVLTGTNAPCVGSGTFMNVGGVMLQGTGYNFGSANCPPCDPFYLTTSNNQTGPGTNNSAISITNFPAQATANRTAGFEVSFSTVGYTNISVSWQQRHQQRTCKYFRLQYSIDGVNFINIPAAQGGVINITGQNVFFPQTNHLSSVDPAIENNPNAKLRLVAEFESTAITGGANGANYVASVQNTAADYRRESEVRLDMFTIWAESSGAPTNAFPTIQLESTNLTIIAGAHATNSITIGDAETPVDELEIIATSANPDLLIDANIGFMDTTGATRRIAVFPTPTCAVPGGTANISVRVTDASGQFSTAVFSVTIQSGSPDVQNTADLGTLKNLPGTNTFTLVDLNTPAPELVIGYNSTITNVLGTAGISISGTTSNRTIVLTPESGALGGTIVSVGASDGNCSDTNSFLFMVVPQPGVILYDSFDYYADGPLTTQVGGGVWLNSTDTPGAIQIASKSLRLNPAAAEETVKVPLLGRGSYNDTSSLPLYAAMKVTLLNLPSQPVPTGNTHIGNFNGPGSPGAQRARFFASNDGATAGFYRLGISSGANVPNAYLATNLSPNVAYTVVTYFNPTNGLTRLWVNPTSESDTFAEATDLQTAPIHFYAFRQRATASDALIDDLVVATSFNDALLIPAIQLRAALVNGNVEISWPVEGADGFTLQSNNDLNTTNWQDVEGTSTVHEGRHVVTISNATGNKFYRLQR